MKVHEIERQNYEIRLTFTYWFRECGPQFCVNVLFSDEIWWVLHPESKKQNSRIWVTVKASEYEECRYSGKPVMSWCGLLGGGYWPILVYISKWTVYQCKPMCLPGYSVDENVAKSLQKA